MIRLLAAALALTLFGAASTSAAPPSGAPALPPLQLDSRPLPLAGALSDSDAWRSYKARFVTEQGRVIDTANGSISHSEGQGYGMLLAVAANDRPAFDRLWGWTRANLMVRDDQLFAWRWEPNQRPAVADMNNATDGELLIAWALVEAAEAWSDPAYRVTARRIAVEVGRKTVINKTKLEALLLPAVSGFSAEDRPDGPVLNLSYWVFPAFPRLALVAPEIGWAGLRQSGLSLVKLARFGPASLPTEWISAKGLKLAPADGFAPTFAYNAIRIPLYLAWAGVGERDHYAPFLALWSQRDGAGLPIVDAPSGRKVGVFAESGFSAIASLLACVADATPLPQNFRQPRTNENYYPATLHLLAVIAAQMRYRSCLNG